MSSPKSTLFLCCLAVKTIRVDETNHQGLRELRLVAFLARRGAMKRRPWELWSLWMSSSPPFNQRPIEIIASFLMTSEAELPFTSFVHLGWDCDVMLLDLPSICDLGVFNLHNFVGSCTVYSSCRLDLLLSSLSASKWCHFALQYGNAWTFGWEGKDDQKQGSCCVVRKNPRSQCWWPIQTW